MKSKVVRRVLTVALAAFMLAGVPGTVQAAGALGEGSQAASHYSGNNVEKQDYLMWSSPILSYLEPLSDGRFMRVQYTDNGEVLVEYYDADLHLSDTRIIPQELPLFGGFYASDSNYYLLTGQSNPGESANVEVFRITKYDLNWKRLGSAGLYDCNTTQPFYAGSARMDMSGKYLLIRTAHQMYKASDGRNHQANMTIKVDTERMEAAVDDRAWYVSHSFNQFIKVENDYIVAVDHGDGYPRAILLEKYPAEILVGKYILEFPGEIGDNHTGASIGGFETSDTAYLIAGNYVSAEELYNFPEAVRNVFVASVNKETSKVEMHWLTNYTQENWNNGVHDTASTPHMVKINKNCYMVLWSEQGKVCYTLVDGNGNQIGKTYTMEGNLSDCAPVVADGKVMWYVWNEEWLNFYQIDIRDISKHSVKERLYGHEIGEPKVTDGILSFACRRCKAVTYQSIIQDYTVYWGDEVYEYVSSFWGYDRRKTGDEVYFHFMPRAFTNENYAPNMELEVQIDNPRTVSWTETARLENEIYGTFTMLSPGQATVTIRPKWNPSLEKKYVFTVKDPVTYEIEEQVSTNYTGLYQYQGKWYYIQKGEVNYNATGLCQYGNGWYYVQNGIVNFKATGLCQYGKDWWYVENGKVNFKATGLCQYGKDWYFVENGAVNFKATGLWNQFGNWWYVQNGAVNFKATGLWNQFGSWWFIQNGAVNFKTTGLCQYGGNWWYVENGAVNFKVTGLCQHGGNWWYVENGAVNFKATGLWNQFGSWWYVENGAVNFKYNGQVPYGNAYYNVVNGRVVF